MAVANQPALPPGASLEGVGRGQCARVLFNSADRPRKKIITTLNDLFYVFTSYSMPNAPKTMELRFPCTSCLSHLPSILTSIAATSFWLVDGLIIIDRRPFKAAVYFIFYIILSLKLLPQTMGGVPPHAPPPTRLCSNIPFTTSANYRVDYWLLSLIGGHLRPWPSLPLYFLMRLALALQSTEPTIARAHRMPRAFFRPIGSGSAKI
jgi:hypothetical protein